jgi:opacity protein-like surface antigen
MTCYQLMAKIFGVLIFSLSTALLSFAQDFPKTEVFAGYSYVRMSVAQNYHQNFNGWNGSLAFNPNRWVGVVADFSGHYSSDSLSNYSFLVGPRFTYRTQSRITPFAHALAGVAREGEGTVSLNGPGGRTYRTGIAYALGGGVDAALTERIAVRVIQLDYFDQDAMFYRNGPRISTGFVFRF